MPTQTYMSTAPDWIETAIFYQIFPDRFANGDPSVNPENVVPWNSKPTLYNHMGGDLRGILNNLDYLVDLGINAIYLNPIFWSTSYHKYNPYDYYTIDPRIGTLDLFIKFVDIAHKNEIKIILDGVFSHCGRGFFPFLDVMENRQNSAYVNWFHITDFPVNAYGHHQYLTWGKSRANPKFNIQNPSTRKYLLDVARYWTKKGIDGWRLDAVETIEDHTFWRDLRCAVKEINPQAYILGEIWNWDNGRKWLQENQLDGITNYAFRGMVLDFFIYKSIRTQEFVNRQKELLSKYQWSIIQAMYNLLGSHDTPRILTLANQDIEKVKLGVLFQFAYPGIPAIYYGDEIGLEGGDDPDNRRAMIWDSSKWNSELRNFFQKVISIRKQVQPLQRGDWQYVHVDDQTNTCVFLRRIFDDIAIIIINNGTEPVTLRISCEQWNLPQQTKFIDKINNYEFYSHSHELLIPNFPQGKGAILVPV